MPADTLFRQLDLCLQDEKNLVDLYTSLADREGFEEIRATLRSFAADCQRHVQLLHNLVALLGGRPESHPAEANASLALHSALVSMSAADGGLARLHRVSALLLAEHKCSANWGLLHALADRAEHAALEEAVHQVEPDKVAHAGYLADLYHDLGLRLLAPALEEAMQARPVAV